MAIAIYRQKTTFCPILRSSVPRMEFLADGCTSCESTSAGFVQVSRCHFVTSCVRGDGISNERSLEDVRGDRNFSP